MSNKYPTLFSEYEGEVVQVVVTGAAFKVLVTVNYWFNKVNILFFF